MTTLRTILLAEDSPADAEMAIDALEEARLAITSVVILYPPPLVLS